MATSRRLVSRAHKVEDSATESAARLTPPISFGRLPRRPFSSSDERLRIEVLTLLSGVRWPTACVILHYCARQPYPILDFRALWSLSCPVPEKGYGFALVGVLRIHGNLAEQLDVSMRELDRGLWQYSKERQPAGS